MPPPRTAGLSSSLPVRVVGIGLKPAVRALDHLATFPILSYEDSAPADRQFVTMS
jgi:hypothetical protein